MRNASPNQHLAQQTVPLRAVAIVPQTAWQLLLSYAWLFRSAN